MYRASSPIFDVPEFPTLRRVKPLPKRRRTSDPLLEESENVAPSSPMLPTEVISDELITQADSLSAQLPSRLQSYYMSTLGGVQDLFKSDPENGTAATIDFSAGYGMDDSRNGIEDDSADTDYIDHLQQPGNTKKRKVPANISGTAHGTDAGSTSGDDEPTDRAIPTGRTDHEYDAAGAPPPSAPPPGGAGLRKGKLSKATLAGLQHKEMLKTRKRQLAVVLGALTHGDTLALDQALSTSYPFAQGGVGVDSSHPSTARVHISRRRQARLARAYKAYYASLSLPNATKHVPFPHSDFTFTCPSATADRLIATKAEVAALHSRFEAELARQAAKAAEAAKQAAAALNSRQLARRNERGKQGRGVSGQGVETKMGSLEQSLLGTPPKSGKKKKRSALANASNPHHLRNYVPSRLPHTGQLSAAQALANTQNLLSPLPMRFLTADVPPRRKDKTPRTTTAPSLNSPADEWICPFCEFDLFYGEENSFQRSVRNRKKILRRRRRARERAAAAASGTGPVTAKDAPPVDDDIHPGFEAPHEEVLTALGKQARWKDERDRGGNSLSHGGLG